MVVRFFPFSLFIPAAYDAEEWQEGQAAGREG
jgi:hypothetical protein